MTERGVGKPWTSLEDTLLRQAVAVHGENDNWKSVALCVPGRTNKACRKRWLHSLSPNVKKSAWTQEEDQLLLSLFAKHGTKWSVIARQIPGRTDDACSKRYREALDPSLRRGEWTDVEDAILQDAYNRFGGKWGQVGQELNRSGLACRNRWRMLERKRSHNNQNRTTPPSQALNHIPNLLGSTSIPPQAWMQAQNPYVEATDYWDPDPSQFSPSDMMLRDDMTDHLAIPGPEFLPPHYSTTSEPPELQDILHDRPPPTPPPFQFTSSSLSSALSLPAVSPSSAYVSSPLTTRPIEHPPTSNPSPSHSSNHDETPISIDHMPVAVSRHELDTSQTIDAANGVCMQYSPDLSALGSPELAIAVPFSDVRQSHSPQRESAAIEMLAAAAADRAYPTPEASPQTQPPIQITEPQTQEPEKDPSRHYRTDAQKEAAQRKRPPTIKRKVVHKEDGPPPRLSATLPASSDPSVLAYVCGHHNCWPEGLESSDQCFKTSQDLYDHWKLEHHDDASCERPFMCGIAGCRRSWKSINGLQYHLQLSKAHFQQALSASITRHVDHESSEDSSPPDTTTKKKLISCPHENCPNQYKQMSGLRYHLAHGHSQELPTQLDCVPPALARKIAEKMHSKTLTNV